MCGRIATIPGDMFSVNIPAAHFDLVVVANVLRLEAACRAQELVARLSAAIKPGGQMLVIDALAGGTPEKDIMREIYSLHLAIRTKYGEAHPPSKVSDWMRDAGMRAITIIDCGVHIGAFGALIGQKT